MSWSLCKSGVAILKAGLHANSDLTSSGVLLAEFSDETEGFINSETKRDWIANPPAANFAGALSDVASADIGNKIAGYDPTGYLNSEFNSIINLNLTKYNKGLAFLKKQEFQTEMD